MLLVVGKKAASRVLCYFSASGGRCAGSQSSFIAPWPGYGAQQESSPSLLPEIISCQPTRRRHFSSNASRGTLLRPIGWFHGSPLPHLSHAYRNTTKLISSACAHSRIVYLHTTPPRSKSRTASSKKKNYFMGVRIEKSRVHPLLKHKSVILLDDKGTIMNQLDSKIALGIVEGNRMEVKLVRKDEKTGLPIFKMISKKALYDEEKLKKKLNKKNRHDVIKEFKIGSKIAEHDLSIKVKKAKEMLDKGYSVRIIVELKISMRRATPELLEAEEKTRGRLAEELVERLSSESSSHVRNSEYGRRKDVAVIFRPVKKLKVGEPGVPSEDEFEAESEGGSEGETQELEETGEEAGTDEEDLGKRP